VAVAQPQVLGFSCESNISPSLAALLQSRLSLSDAQLQRWWWRAQALGFSCESNISPSLTALLQLRLSLSDAQLRKVVALCQRCTSCGGASCALRVATRLVGWRRREQQRAESSSQRRCERRHRAGSRVAATAPESQNARAHARGLSLPCRFLSRVLRVAAAVSASINMCGRSE
jgi:hypothetical protein